MFILTKIGPEWYFYKQKKHTNSLLCSLMINKHIIPVAPLANKIKNDQ